jgi:hypothetical protein
MEANSILLQVSSTAIVNGEKMTAPKRRSFSKIIACGN